jgi:chromosome segregation ATPase
MTACRMTFGRLAAVTLLCMATVQIAAGQEDATPKGARRAAASAAASAASKQAASDRALLHQIAEAQRSLGDEVQRLKERLEEAHNTLGGMWEQHVAHEGEMKAMREEVKGLYVESSAVKQAIDALKEDIQAVDSNVSGFRTFSGFFIAVMILLLAVISVLTIRR